MGNAGAKPIILLAQNLSEAKPYLPFPREGDHAFGVVVGSSLTPYLHLNRIINLLCGLPLLNQRGRPPISLFIA